MMIDRRREKAQAHEQQLIKRQVNKEFAHKKETTKNKIIESFFTFATKHRLYERHSWLQEQLNDNNGLFKHIYKSIT